MTDKKKIAIAILNRNAPDLTNNLVETLLQDLSDFIEEKDIFVLENGSDDDKHSKYAKIVEKKSLGVGWGMNKLVNHCYDLGYDYIWLKHNDVDLPKAKEFLVWSLQLFDRDDSVGVTIPWKDSWVWNTHSGEAKRSHDNQNVSFWDHISTIFSRKSIDITKSFNDNFNPFDEENYGGHYLMICPSISLYSNNMRVVTNSNFLVEELNMYTEDNKEKLSTDVRGFSDNDWKQKVGPESVKKWFEKLFPNQLEGYNIKQKRNILINNICNLARKCDFKKK